MSLLRPLSIASLLALQVATSSFASSPPSPARSSQSCFDASGKNFSEVLNCYKEEQAAIPLKFVDKGTRTLPGITIRSFELFSQNWSPGGKVTPTQWSHDVDIYIPTFPKPHPTALLLADDGMNREPDGDNPVKPMETPPEVAIAVAIASRTTVITVSNVPNQVLYYEGSSDPKYEGTLVAHSWAQFLKNPEAQPFASVDVAMMESLVKTMDLAEQELGIKEFIAAGGSKRAWAAWLATIADERITGIIPVVLDINDMGRMMDNTYKAYGGSWPAAWADYLDEGALQQRLSVNFKKLETIEDPLRYLQSRYASHLAIRKFIVSASGDDLFPPDSQNFARALPGPTSMRMIPNAGHGGVGDAATSLLPVLAYWQNDRELPTVNAREETVAGKRQFRLHFSKAPISLTYWKAHNPTDRDFRYECDIRYEKIDITPSGELDQVVQVDTPEGGWEASFFAATFADLLAVTSEVTITPNTYPDHRPEDSGRHCKTIAQTTSR
ncbi:PhoPQ-activated protein PqaA family protein [Pseudomonas gingeri]